MAHPVVLQLAKFSIATLLVSTTIFLLDYTVLKKSVRFVATFFFVIFWFIRSGKNKFNKEI